MRAHNRTSASTSTNGRPPHTRKIAYLRISTAEQKPDRQIDGLKMICDELHIETLSATARRRPVYEAVMRRLQPGDLFIIWDLDRAWRSAKDALGELDKLRERGIDFLIANLDIDTTTPHGRLVYTIMGALAEFERATLSRRTKEGLASARARGKRLGRPPILSDRQLHRAERRIAKGATYSAVAAVLGVDPWTLSCSLQRYRARTGG